MAEQESVRQIAERMLADLEGLEAQQAAWWATVDRGSYLEEQEEPLWAYLESCLDIARVETVRHAASPDESRTLERWELLLCAGGPSAGLELEPDGRARVWAAWWSAPEYVTGELPWLAEQLEELGL